MAAVATQRWSDDNLRATAKDWNATLSWDVVDAANEMEAKAAALSGAGTPIPVVGDAHPRSQYLLCNDVSPKNNGFRCWIVTAQYSTSQPGGSNPNDPINEPPKIRWLVGSESEAIEVSARNAAGKCYVISNANGDSFEGGVPSEGPTLHFTWSRWEPFYLASRAMTYALKTNKTAVTVRGGGTFDRGQLLCRSIQPANEYSFGDRLIRVNYEFEMRAGRQKDKDGKFDGFKARVLNAGYNGWWDNSGTKQKDKFYMAGSTPDHLLQPSNPVLLKEDGTPVDTAAGYVVGPKCKPPAATPAGAFPIDIEVEQVYVAPNNLIAVWLHFSRFGEAEFADLAL